MSSDAFDDDDVHDARARVGQTLRGKWHLDALIGAGGMAAVYAATHRNGRRGAVKVLHPYRTCLPRVAARFRREGYLANKVGHPNAVSVLDDDVDDEGNVFLVMELLEGATLATHADAVGGALPAEPVLFAMEGVLDVLVAAHRAGLVHRDIKPENVFVTYDWQVKVLDFGIAGLREPTGGRVTTAREGTMGTPAFMSPEQARARWDEVGPQSDLWSVGATTYTLLSGKILHEEGTAHEVMAALITRPPPRLADALPGICPAIAQVVDRALQVDRAHRWQTAEAMRDAVHAARQALRAFEAAPTSRRATLRRDSRLEATAPSASARSVRRGAGLPAQAVERGKRRAAIAASAAVAFAITLALAGRGRDARPAAETTAHAASERAPVDEVSTLQPVALAPPPAGVSEEAAPSGPTRPLSPPPRAPGVLRASTARPRRAVPFGPPRSAPPPVSVASMQSVYERRF